MRTLRFLPALILVSALLPLAAQGQRTNTNTYAHAPRSVRSRDVNQEHLKLDLTINLEDEQFKIGRAHV